MTRRTCSWVIQLGLALLLFTTPALAQEPLPSQPAPSEPVADSSAAPDVLPPALAETAAAPAQPDKRITGTIKGRVLDQAGTPIVGAHVKLILDSPQSPVGTNSQDALRDAETGDNGDFSFANVAPGAFHVEITMQGFATQVTPGNLRAGEASTMPQITLTLATASMQVIVTPSIQEIAQDQIKIEEKQRVLGVFPNFYVTYVHDAAPLTPKQKFELAWKSTVDPVNLAINGVIAGVQQAQNNFSSYGQGAQGYAKRYGASFGDSVADNFISGAILPSLFKQDPRYFYKGTGTKKSRLLYAMASAVICKGDNRRWQPNYSSILGNLAAGGISNLYYPAGDRNGLGLTVETALIGIGATAATNVLEEFVIRKFTPGLKNNDPNRDFPQPAPKLESVIAKFFPKPTHSGD
jgi:hypothetical protein